MARPHLNSSSLSNLAPLVEREIGGTPRRDQTANAVASATAEDAPSSSWRTRAEQADALMVGFSRGDTPSAATGCYDAPGSSSGPYSDFSTSCSVRMLSISGRSAMPANRISLILFILPIHVQPPRPRCGREWPESSSQSGRSDRGWRRPTPARLRSRRRWLAAWRGVEGEFS